MKLGTTLLGELQKMKEKMDLVWNDLFEKNPGKKDEDFQWVEKLPKFGGAGIRTLRSRSSRNIKSF